MEDLYATLDCLQDCLYGNESQVVANSQQKNQQQRVIYEESIMMTLLGPDYVSLFTQDTAEFVHEDAARQRFQQMFEHTIRYVF